MQTPLTRNLPWSKKAASRGLAPSSAWAEAICERLVTDCHPKQRDFVLDDAPRLAARVGRGGGKTTGGRARLLMKMCTAPRARLAYIATTRPQAQLLMWEPLKLVCERLGLQIGKDVVFNETKLWFTVKRTGALLQLTGADDQREIDKLRGQPFDEVGIDEAGIHPPRLLENLVERVIGPRLRGALWLISTPGKNLDGMFYDVTRPGSLDHRPYAERDRDDFAGWDGWSSHHWALNDPDVLKIPEMAEAWARALREKERKGWSDENPIWRREYLAEWAADDTENVFRYRPHLEDGSPWNQWAPDMVGSPKMAALPKEFRDWHWGIALDQGYRDPLACNVFAFSPQDPRRRIYHVFSFEQTGMYARPIAELLVGTDHVAATLAGKPGTEIGGVIGRTGWPDVFVMDGDQALLDELGNVYGIRIAKADKNANYKQGAIELVNGDLIDGRLQILKQSPLEDQVRTLQWKVDEDTRIMKEDKAQANHSSDTMVYFRAAAQPLLASFEAPEQTKRRSVQPMAPAVYQPDSLDEDPAGPRNSRQADDWTGLLSEGSFDDDWGNG